MKRWLIRLSAAVAMLACAGSAEAAQVSIANAWFRWLPAHLPAAGYFDLHNGRTKTITLTGADSPDCGALMLHKSEQKSGVDTMSDVSSVDIPAGGTLKFSPGGYHLMCMNPGPPMKPGGTVQVRLHLANGSILSASFAVKNPVGQ